MEAKMKVINSDEIRRDWQEVDLGMDLPPGYRVYLHPDDDEMHYLLFEKEIVLIFIPGKKRLIELLDTVLAHDYNQRRKNNTK